MPIPTEPNGRLSSPTEHTSRQPPRAERPLLPSIPTIRRGHMPFSLGVTDLTASEEKRNIAISCLPRGGGHQRVRDNCDPTSDESLMAQKQCRGADRSPLLIRSQTKPAPFQLRASGHNQFCQRRRQRCFHGRLVAKKQFERSLPGFTRHSVRFH